MNIFRKFRAALQLREAVRKADEAHDATGNRFYVVPGAHGKLVVLDRFNFRRLRMKHYIPQNARVNNLLVESFYFTANRSGGECLSEKQRKIKTQNFFAWVEATHKVSKRL